MWVENVNEMMQTYYKNKHKTVNIRLKTSATQMLILGLGNP